MHDTHSHHLETRRTNRSRQPTTLIPIPSPTHPRKFQLLEKLFIPTPPRPVPLLRLFPDLHFKLPTRLILRLRYLRRLCLYLRHFPRTQLPNVLMNMLLLTWRSLQEEFL